MPTYDYECQECRKRFSMFLPISKRDQAQCPECKSSNVRQLFTGFLYSRSSSSAGSASGGCSGGSCGSCSGC